MKNRKLRIFLMCMISIFVFCSYVPAIAISEKNGEVDIKEETSIENIDNQKEEENSKEKENVEEIEITESEKQEEEENIEAEEKEEYIDEDKENHTDEKKDEEDKEAEKGKEENIEEDKVDIEKDKVITEGNVTTKNFKEIIGNYTLKNILGNYNVFSFEEIRGSHIIGPIVAKNRACKTREDGGALTVSDLAKGVPSYVGEIARIKDGSRGNVTISYSKDAAAHKNTDFYVSEEKNRIRIKTGNETLYYVVDGKGEYPAPNGEGRLKTFQNNNFINFDEMREEILKESRALLKKNNNILVLNEGEKEGNGYVINKEGRLDIDVGKNYIIKDASKLKVVNLIYPKGYDPIVKPYPYGTTINFEGNSLFGVDIDGIKQNLLPEIWVNGVMFNGNGAQYGSENNIVWNLPNIETKGEQGRIVRNGVSDILGHIVAPNGVFWNSNKNGSWHGGNINGCAIVKSWYGGNMESHMWPYGDIDIGEEEKEIIKFVIKKVDRYEETPLKGAVFDIYEANEKGEPIGEKIKGNIETKDNGEITVEDSKLKYDRLYVLVETKAPDGYVIGRNIVFYIKGDGEVNIKPIDTIEIKDKGTIVVKNAKGNETLPETGGKGTDKYILIAAVIMLISAILLKLNNKRAIIE